MKIILNDEERQHFPKDFEDIEFRISSWQRETPIRRYQSITQSHDLKDIDKSAPILLTLNLQSIKSLGELENDIR